MGGCGGDGGMEGWREGRSRMKGGTRGHNM